MNIIDFRMRAPLKGYIGGENAFFQIPVQEAFSSLFNMKPPQYLYDGSFETMVNQMKENNVVKGVVPVRRMNNLVSNEDMMEMMNNYPELIGMPGVDAANIPEALEIIDKYCVNGPCKGITIEPGLSFPPVKADDESLFPIYQKCQDNDLIVFLSFGGLTGPDISYNDPKIIFNIAMAFPKTKFVLAHGGYPYTTEIIFTILHLSFLLGNPNVYLLPDFYLTDAPGCEAYIKAIDFIPDNMIFGSACPICDPKMMIDYYVNCGAKPENIEKVMYKNAAKLLGL